MSRASILAAVIALSGCSDAYVDDIKQHAPDALSENGFKVVGYQGYEWGSFGNWGGAVWYTLEKDGITYEAAVTKWGHEYHIYNLKALNAVETSK